MKADAKPTLEEVAALLCKGAAPHDWVIEKLRQNVELVGYRNPSDNDDTVERLLLVSAVDLDNWLSLYSRIEQQFGIEMPDCIDQVSQGLAELIPFLKEQIRLPSKGGPIPDARLRLCAAVCSGIWQELHGQAQPYSPNLQDACERYWVACGHPKNPSGNVKKWERLLLWATTT